ncbi:MAG TPA: bifunctional phosphopantothenoylcysteine decarboxylase/phosphopantothenate--cysteine ligase CoaBC [Solirubrobacteraceae bacterium]|nr:bifunctional phosphopantothenoylcysteine decarboxylase/phosphopantothenate--cysteine ligase CoaBC [Solirubrobacteraceae bacterium]
MARLLIGVSGGIAAYKAIETARLAVRAGHAVRVIQTERSTAFVGPASFEAITGAPVLTDEFEADPLRGAYPGEPTPATTRTPISHLALVQRADAYLIAPASANTIARLAAGLADSLLTTAALAAGGEREGVPVLVAPAMNDRMYRHPATRANLALLARRGVTIVGPGVGELASHGEHGPGRMSEPAELLAAVEAVLARGESASAPDGRGPSRWLGRRVLVTAGGTREPIDAVRYIGNRSSGRMGYALAARVAARGAEVTLVSANVALEPPPGVRVVEVRTAAELQAACERTFPECDALLMAAAVADFRPAAPAAHKLKKTEGPPSSLALEPTPDVITALAARRRPGQLIVGFAAEHGPGALDYGRDKLARKGLDAVVVNDVSQAGIGFDAADNEVTVLTAGGRETRLGRAGKDRIADGILDLLEDLATGGEEDVRGAGTDRAARV